MRKTRTDVEKCGTCQYWTGKREPVFDKNGQPKIIIYDEEGICEKGNCRFVE